LRIWTVHPKYLDARGLVALWREALLAREVLRGRTLGYRHHPQLERFRACEAPLVAVNVFLKAVYVEAERRGYAFDASKLGRCTSLRLSATHGQLLHEWGWLLSKLKRRAPERFRQFAHLDCPDAHPLFRLRVGPVARWERNLAPHHQW
jgi:hypothetical protein